MYAPLQFHAVSDHSFLKQKKVKLKILWSAFLHSIVKSTKEHRMLPKYEYISMMKEEKKKLRC